MDRLVYEDVGSVKTEMLYVAFKRLPDNKRVAVLVPTTILALQRIIILRKTAVFCQDWICQPVAFSS